MFEESFWIKLIDIRLDNLLGISLLILIICGIKIYRGLELFNRARKGSRRSSKVKT